MATNDIIASLGMVSPLQMPPRLIDEIYVALQERDNLRAENKRLLIENETLHENIDLLANVQERFGETLDMLRIEMLSDNKRLRAAIEIVDKPLTRFGTDSIKGRKMLSVNVSDSEWIYTYGTGLLDCVAALGETGDKPDVNAAVVVEP